MFLIDTLILVTGVLLLLGIVSSKLSTRLGLPVLVLFLLVGMLAGSEGLGGLEFENYKLAHAIGTAALAMILFDGGLGTSVASIRASWKPSLLLATVGVLVTADSSAAGRLVKELALPGGVVIAMITRGDKVIPPQGITRIHANDHVILVLRPGMELLVDQVFSKRAPDAAPVPPELEFPFRGSTTVGELEGFYSIYVHAPPTATLDEVMRRELGPDRVEVDAVVEFDLLRFRILRLTAEGRIELVGMSILPEPEDFGPPAESPSGGP